MKKHLLALFFIALISYSKLNAQCTASFTYSANGGDVTVSAVGSSTSTSVYGWQWGDGTTLPGLGQNATHSYTASGTYSLCLTYVVATLSPCTTQVCETINIVVTSLNETASRFNQISIHPNPAADVVNFDFTLSKASKVVITVFDITGKAIEVIKDEQQFLEAGKHSKRLNTSKLLPGVYFVNFKNESASETKKLVIQ